MTKPIYIKVSDIIGSSLCISAEDGQKVFGKILPVLKDGQSIVLSFENVEVLISLFLNVAIGQLYGVFSPEQIKAQVAVEGLAEDDVELLKRVIENAKKYYANAKAYDTAWEGINDEE